VSEQKVVSGHCKHGRPWYNVRVTNDRGESWWAWDTDEKTPCPECEAEKKAAARRVAEDLAFFKWQARRD
jgi:hypothetical protein